VKVILEDIKKEIDEKKESEATGPEGRMRQNMYSTLAKKFEEMLIECDEVQTGFRQKVKDKVRKQVMMRTSQTVDDEATPEQVEQLVDHPEQVQKLVDKALVGANLDIVHMVEELQDRYNEITALAKVRSDAEH
jgi:t-SNARE complex subunit (syntaxin)